jgi:hypothetical protein
MKKLILAIIVALIFTGGVIFGASWAKNSWITSAVNKGLEQSGQAQNAETAAKLNGLRDCSLESGIVSTPTGKEANIKCFNASDQVVNLKAEAVKDGKLLVFDKYRFEGFTVQ